MRHPLFTSLLTITAQRLIFTATFFIAVYASSTGATAQNAYKCGATYSQTPCPGGVTVDVNDARSSTQKSQTDSATAKGSKAADAMEKTRLAQEAQQRKDMASNPGAGSTVIGASSPTPTPETPDAKRKISARKKAPDYFTAQVPGEKKPKKVVKAKQVKEKAAKTDKAATQP